MKNRLILLSSLFSTAAFAGGFEFPDNGAEALGRGATFTAKADSPLALEYNVAGLARQRGNNLLLDIGLPFHTYDFTRAGTYASGPAADPPLAYAGQAYPTVHNRGKQGFLPFLGYTTDFRKFDRWTFSIGMYTPSAIANREYVGSVTTASGATAAAPQRYDLLKAEILVVYPTLAAAVRATKWLDLGVALNVVVGHFKLSNAIFNALGAGQCPFEYENCDSVSKVTSTGATATVTVGAMVRPIKSLSFGLQLRAPFTLATDGTVESTSPKVSNLTVTPQSVSFTTHFPLVLRAGARYIFLKDDFEAGDIEFDFVYEGWGQFTEESGDQLKIASIGPYNDVDPLIEHHYHDTYSARLGGAYNLKLPKGVLTFRLGSFYDSAATKSAYTKLDADTMDKWGFTGGLGYKIRGVQLNVAYAFLYSPDRDVTNGALRGADAVNHGMTVDGSNNLLPVYNNGKYHAQTQIFSFGLTVAWDEALRKNRVIHYQ